MRSEQRNGPVVVTGILVVILAFVATHNTWALDFKGVSLGKPLFISEERSVFGKLDCNPMRLSDDEYRSYVAEIQQTMPGVRKVCAGSASIAAVPADVTVLLGPSRRVLRLTFQFAGDEYPQVVEAMSLKWGPGIVEERAANDKSVWWDFEDGSTVSVHQIPGEGGTGSGESAAPVFAMAEYAVAAVTPTGDL